MQSQNPKEFLLSTLRHFDITVTSHEEKMVYLDKAYTIEIEQANLFKLTQGGQVIAPFADAEELCKFVKMDMQLNEEN